MGQPVDSVRSSEAGTIGFYFDLAATNFFGSMVTGMVP